ncbi:hypothetical protein BJ999_001972 [Actinomadura citrea]|uniref:Uncharacterized protein n=1 Tax=Actinomadura citrea TaxID=46158 RepID=A0A7Y9KBX0_9ACTN|nr:hypothetical protein [Actinomadura citrea]
MSGADRGARGVVPSQRSTLMSGANRGARGVVPPQRSRA